MSRPAQCTHSSAIMRSQHVRQQPAPSAGVSALPPLFWHSSTTRQTGQQDGSWPVQSDDVLTRRALSAFNIDSCFCILKQPLYKTSGSTENPLSPVVLGRMWRSLSLQRQEEALERTSRSASQQKNRSLRTPRLLMCKHQATQPRDNHQAVHGLHWHARLHSYSSDTVSVRAFSWTQSSQRALLQGGAASAQVPSLSAQRPVAFSLPYRRCTCAQVCRVHHSDF